MELKAQRVRATAEQTRRVGDAQSAQSAEAAARAAAATAHVKAPDPGQAGPSSLRSFAGEDNDFLDRKRQQQSQQVAWNASAEQMSAMQAGVQRAEAAADHATMQAQQAYAASSFAAAQAARSQAAVSTAAANLSLAEQKRGSDAAAAAERSATRLQALVVDDGPAEGAPRTEFRGFTPGQLGGVRDTQAAQRCAAECRGMCALTRALTRCHSAPPHVQAGAGVAARVGRGRHARLRRARRAGAQGAGEGGGGRGGVQAAAAPRRGRQCRHPTCRQRARSREERRGACRQRALLPHACSRVARSASAGAPRAQRHDVPRPLWQERAVIACASGRRKAWALGGLAACPLRTVN